MEYARVQNSKRLRSSTASMLPNEVARLLSKSAEAAIAWENEKYLYAYNENDLIAQTEKAQKECENDVSGTERHH